MWVSRPVYNRFYDEDVSSPLYQYVVVLYCSVLALGGNEMGPRSNSEIIAMIGILVGLTMYNALIFGEMSVLVGEVSKKANGFQEAVDVANTAMRSMGLPPNTAKKVRTYLVTTQGTKYEQTTLTTFLGNISPSLKQQVSQNIFAKIVERSWRLAALCIDLAKKSPDVKAKKITLRAAQEELVMLIVANMTNDL